MKHYYSKLSEGQIIVHNKRYKVIRKVKKDYIETIYLKPTKTGWRKVEHLPLYETLRPLKIGEYKDFLSKVKLSEDVLNETIEL